MDSNLPLLYLSVLIVLLLVSGWFIVRQVVRTRRIEKTLSQLQKRVRGKDATAKDFYELGGLLLDKKLYSQAVVQLQKALKSKDLKEEENKALVYNALGYAYAAQEQYDLAIRQYKDALSLQPEYVTALNNLGFAYEKKNLDAQALDAYEAVLKYDSKNKVAKKRSESLRKRLPIASS
ncbi:tetratricopeptide repeat protein [Baaleninema simplex]|uniref:tetratricopeptide repeat protein n=1 Tax=Baaleninema simplex TaxID=2862350 RepID=UPI00034D7398|nr:tetratricopeptide repeat protein [Baaleninema simplex]